MKEKKEKELKFSVDTKKGNMAKVVRILGTNR